ncbi:hypothetical protein BDR07DRAFT_1493932 [Suillus spraguei]|nr:hypothetical protein BDR07DRAFT_1493932 [Suillus spraguei]
MGMNNLWELLEPAAKTVPITLLALQDHYVGPAPHLPYVIGVDASGWFEQSQQGKWHYAHAQNGQNPALRTFLFCLTRLTQFPSAAWTTVCCVAPYAATTRAGVSKSGETLLNVTLRVIPLGRWGQLHPALARSLPESFPSVGTINSYGHPAVTSLAEVPKLQLPAPPDLAQLACVIQQFLGWDLKKLLSAFCTTIWPVVILHELLEDVANNSPRSNEFSLASGCTRAVFLNHASRQKKMHRGISGYNTDVPVDMLEKATMQLREEPAPGHQDDITSSHKIYDCWVKTMFLSLSGDLCTESHPPSTFHTVCQVSAHPVSNFNSDSPVSSSVSVIDLTEDEDAVAFASGAIIDLTGDDDSELIDLTL